MGVTRRVIFPALRIVIWAVIAVALVQLAFGGNSSAPDPGPGAEDPGAVFTDPQVEVTTASITNTVSVAASVVADAHAEAKATQDGYVNYFEVDDGATVAEGDRLLVVRQEIPRDPIETTDDEGNVTVTERRPEIVTSVVRAPVAGVVRFVVLTDQTVTIGDVVARVDPGTHSVVGSLTPEQQYRLVGAPTEASVEIPGGPAPFTCTGLTTGVAASEADPGEVPADGTSVQARCAVPAGVTVFTGLTATLAITTGSVEDALVLPVTAVQGSFDTGNVWVALADGESEERAVRLGLTDGEVVQITEGLALGDLVLEFVPVGDVEPVDPYADEYVG